MKRTTTALSAFAAGAALLLAGCGSDTSGTASPAAPSVTSQAPATSGMSDTSTSESTSADDSTSSEESTSDDSTSESTSDDSTSESTSDDSSTADTSATTTVGGGGDLDDTSVTWFDTYCTGVAPVLDQVKDISSAASGSSDPKAMMKKLSTVFTAMGNSFTKTAKDLDGVPAPTFDGGDTLASSVLKAMNEFGPKFTKIGTALAKGDTSALQSMASDMQGLQDLNRFKVDAGTLAAIKEIPSCKPLFSMGG